MPAQAAFYRFEGTLSSRATLVAAGWLAANAQGMRERILRLGNVMLAAPFVAGGPLHDATTGARVAWMGLRGVTEDRLIVLGQEYADRFVIPGLRSVGLELVAESRRVGQRIVLVSDNLDVIMGHVARHLEVEDFVCNSLELRDGKATGRLHDPVISGAATLGWARSFAADHDIDLGSACGYGASKEDGLFLSGVGRPCAVRPDRALRQLARDLDWPIVEER